MFGKNVIRKPVLKFNGFLDVVGIFKTFQGEGPHTGCKSVFIRLGGCNLACDFCDTEFDDFNAMSLSNICAEVDRLATGDEIELIVITGGEPFRQPIEGLCLKLIQSGYKVQIETNGTLCRDVPAEVDIVCSPKNTGHGYKSIRPDILERSSCLKFVVSKHRKQYKEVPDVGQGKYNISVYVQPMDECDEDRNGQNLQYVIDLCIKHQYNLSIQMHKIIGVD